MAIAVAFEASDSIVQLISNHGRGGSFYVHRGLIEGASEYLTNAVLDASASLNCYADSHLVIQIPVSECAVACFVQWLYTNKTCQPGEMPKTMSEILSVYRWTKDYLHHIGFRDALIDDAVKMLTNQTTPSSLYEIVNAIAEDFDDIDGGLSILIVDFLIQSPLMTPYVYAELSYRLSRASNSHSLRAALRLGFLEAKISDRDYQQLFSWTADSCRYHEHAPCASCPGHSSCALQPDYPTTTPPPTSKPTRKSARIRFTGQGTDQMDIDNEGEESIIYKPLIKKSRQSDSIGPPRLWTPDERRVLLTLVIENPESGWEDISKKHNDIFTSKMGKIWHRSGGSIKQEFVKNIGCSDRVRSLASIPNRIAELEREMDAADASNVSQIASKEAGLD